MSDRPDRQSPLVAADAPRVHVEESAHRHTLVAHASHRGDPAADTADFNDTYTGNLRLDYLLPSANLDVRDCGVFWPAHGLLDFDPGEVSDHRLVWLDITL